MTMATMNKGLLPQPQSAVLVDSDGESSEMDLFYNVDVDNENNGNADNDVAAAASAASAASIASVPLQPTRSEMAATARSVMLKRMGYTRQEPINHVHFAHTILSEGDTLVFVDIPSGNEQARKRISCDGIVPGPQHFKLHSEKLFALSGSKFPAMLDNHIYQARVKRRRKPTEELMQGIKYLLDLTPPSEGEDLVFQLSELSLTPGLVKWCASTHIHGADASLVRGHDDVCSCQTASWESLLPRISEMDYAIPEPGDAKSLGLPPTAQDILRMRNDGFDAAVLIPPCYRIPDYCIVRHCNNIIRLMLLIEGKPVKLDSAARVWTLVGISTIFECPSVVRDQVATWIMSNSPFTEVLPEEALRIGFRLQIPGITQSAFHMLVNELALEEAAAPDMPRRPHTTIFGRRRASPDDETSNIIQHAARALVERVNTQYEDFISEDFLQRTQSLAWHKILQIERLLEAEQRRCPTGDKAAPEALREIRYIRSEIQKKIPTITKSVMDRKLHDGIYVSHDNDRAKFVEPPDFENISAVVSRFTPTQKLLCPWVYQVIEADLKPPVCFSERLLESAICLREKMQIILNRKRFTNRQNSWAFLTDDSGNKFTNPVIDFNKLESQVQIAIKPFLSIKNPSTPNGPTFTRLNRHLIQNLNQSELKYLPLWAGGNDDGTGGVFESFLPPAEMGPIGPGPAYRTGMTIPSAPPSISDSLMDEINTMKIRGSTVAGSVDAQDSISTVYGRNHVIPLGSSIATESFKDDMSEFDQARHEVPAARSMAGISRGTSASQHSSDDWTMSMNHDDGDDADDFDMSDDADFSDVTIGASDDDFSHDEQMSEL